MDLKRIVRIAMMAALIFAGTYTFKIPIAITGGYTHLGDCAIFVGVMLLGRRGAGRPSWRRSACRRRWVQPSPTC